MGRSIGNFRTPGLPMPVVPTENKGIMSGPIRKPRRQGRRRKPRGSRPDEQKIIGMTPRGPVYQSAPRDMRSVRKETFRDINRDRQGRAVGRRRRRGGGDIGVGGGPGIPPRFPRPLTGGYNPESGVRYTDTGVPTAVEQTKRVPVQDPTLGGPPEREVPIPKERLQRITRESDPRGSAPFSPDEQGMARDRFFERMFDRADEAKQQRSMEREDMRETRRAVRDERKARRSEPGEIDIDAERGGRRRRRRGGMMRRRRGRRRDFTRRRSEMEGGRRGRSREERAAFRDRYVSTLR